MDHFINSKETIVTDAIDGFLLGRGNTITRLDGYPDIKVVVRSDWKKEKSRLSQVGDQDMNRHMLVLLEAGY